MEWESFEELVRQVLTAKGFVAEVTQSTSDGGIDVIAHRDEPFLRGKYVVQCKNWSTPVGVSVVRDLYGAMTHERASKGILITTSSFTRGAVEFAEDKPLELIDGDLWRELVKETSPVELPETASLSRAQVAQEMMDTFDELSVWARRTMRELDDFHAKEPLISDDHEAATKGYRERYREIASESIASFCHALSESAGCAGRLKHVMNRWVDLRERGYGSELPEERKQLERCRHHIAKYKELFEKSFDTYHALKRTSPHPTFGRCHTDALEGMYYGLSAVLSLFISAPVKEYEGKTVYVTVGGPQELVDYYTERYQQLMDSASQGLQPRSWLDRLPGRL